MARHWHCIIGETTGPRGGLADEPMRQAVAESYQRLTGFEPSFVFSGWDTELDESYRAVVEDRDPDPARIIAELEERLAAARAYLVGAG